MREYTVLHLFSGIGGAALGFQEAKAEYKGLLGSFRTLAGIDCDSEACRDFKAITGAPAVEMDLFSRSDYVAFHGKQPPGEWVEVTPLDILDATNGEYPDLIFLSPPCKGFSGLLPSERAKSEKYQALNRLVTRGLQLVMDAYADDLPSVIMLENVPRITSRGEFLLKQVKRLLGRHGYVFHEGTHDCGELGGLGQRRKRYLLIARLPDKMPSFIYRPPTQRLKSIGDVIEPLPMPDDPAMGPMHRLPRLQWKTWVRLALIPAGGDWRDLNRDCYANIYQIIPWDGTASTVTGSHRPNNGAISIADPRLDYSPRSGAFRVVKWDDTAPTVTGSTGPGRSNGISGIADPRLNCRPRSGSYGVMRWDEPAKTVIGAGDIHAGSAAVADPRIPGDREVLDPPPIIIALDGMWHRPLTTFELAMLQSFPAIMPNGRPFQLVGNSDARWRERIGNAVPPDAAEAIGEEILTALMASEKNKWMLSSTGIWVIDDTQMGYKEGFL